MMNALIVDDEEHARDYLKLLLERHVPEITSILVAADAIAGLELIESHHPQLVFLDVEMPGLSGFELLERVAEKTFDVIFTTAFHQYAIKAIRISALDYLMKPVDAQELRAAVERCLLRQPVQQQRDQLYNHLLHSIRQPPDAGFRLAIPTAEGIIFFSPGEIIRCEAERSYTRFHLNNNKKFVASKPLKEYEELLGESGFIRVHKSHLVNKEFVQRIAPEGLVMANDDSVIRISRRRKAEVELMLRRGA